MKKNIRMSVVVLAISIAFVFGLMAQERAVATQAAPSKATSVKMAPAKESWEKAKGMIEKVDGATKEIMLQTHKEKMSFLVNEHTRISQDASKMHFSSLKKGMAATVEYKKEGNKMVAEWIDLSGSRTQSMQATSPTVKKEMMKENASAKTMGKK